MGFPHGTHVCHRRYCDKLMPSHAVRAVYNILFSIPFNSANKWALSLTGAFRGMGAICTVCRYHGSEDTTVSSLLSVSLPIMYLLIQSALGPSRNIL